MARLIVRLETITTDVGECPGCGFDSLRRVQGFLLSASGVSTCFDQTICGRCADRD